MKQIFNVFQLARQANRISTNVFNYLSHRGVRYDSKITWKEPEKYKHFHPIRTGDRATLTVKNPDEIHFLFRNSKELETADEKVKKIFSLQYQKYKGIYEHYKSQLIEKVKEHPLDNNSRSVKIAELTAKIRHFQNMVSITPSRYGKLKGSINSLVNIRRKWLGKLRSEDYKKFEWILEVLDLEFRPGLHKDTRRITRKTSLIQLAKLKAEKIKEEKLAALKKSYDEQKLPFLEKKVAKLKEIKEMEEKFGLPLSVSDEDIEKCIKKMEKVKLDIAENARVGYLRKVHPYTLEPYNENLLQEKEKAGQLIRQQMEQSQQKSSPKDSPS